MSLADKQPQDEGQQVAEGLPEAAEAAQDPSLTRVEDHRPEGYQGDCLRPMGLCELGGCCDLCWYGNPSLRRCSDSKGAG